jgi:membrane-associated phospholipid phosphatase
MQSKRSTLFLEALFTSLLILTGFAAEEPAHAESPLDNQLSSPFNGRSSLTSPACRSITFREEGAGHSEGSFFPIQLYHDMTYLLREPDFYGVVGGIGFAPSVFGSAFRRESLELTENWGTSMLASNFFEAGEVIGEGTVPVAAAVASWGIGKLTSSSRLSKFGSDLFRAQAINGFLTIALKAGINRRRPNGGPYSYPSGHSSVAFAAAGTVYANFGKTWGIPAFAVAGYVGLSRLQERKHYVSDVMAGGILGTYVALKLARRHRMEDRVSVSPLVNNNCVGLSFGLKF